ncbi:MAG: hypothetical protein AAFX50_01595 [Acidobacteriota bacterium]
MKSLFVLSLPRSLSSFTYHLARRALGLREPSWTTDGEILNNDRHVLFRGNAHDTGLKYLHRRQCPWMCDQITAFLDQVVQPQGFAYKDVVHPFVVADWSALDRLAVLVIRRPVAEVAWSVVQKDWRYPGHAIDRRDRGPAAASDLPLRGLLMAETRLDDLVRRGAASVDYDDLIRDESSLTDALQALYPDASVPRVPYIDDRFIATRTRALARRDADGFRELERRIEALRADAPSPVGDHGLNARAVPESPSRSRRAATV